LTRIIAIETPHPLISNSIPLKLMVIQLHVMSQLSQSLLLLLETHLQGAIPASHALILVPSTPSFVAPFSPTI